MDNIDLKILNLLKEHSRTSFNEISKVIGKTETTIRRRVKKLEENGTINKYTIIYDIYKKKKMATVTIEPKYDEIKRIVKKLKYIDEITNIWRLSGDCGLLLKLEFATINEFHHLIEEKIALIEGVKIIKTCFITKIVK